MAMLTPTLVPSSSKLPTEVVTQAREKVLVLVHALLKRTVAPGSN
jgi:hypothetical protein